MGQGAGRLAHHDELPGRQRLARDGRGDVRGQRGTDAQLASRSAEAVAQFDHSVRPAAPHHDDPGHTQQLGVLELDTGRGLAVIEHAETADDRAFAATALTQSAVMASRWNRVLGAWPITAVFPGGNE